MNPFQKVLLVFLTCGFVSQTFAGIPGSVDPSYVLTLSETVQYLVPVKDGLVIGTGAAGGLANLNWQGVRDTSFVPRTPSDFVLDRESVLVTRKSPWTFSEISGEVQLALTRTGSLAYPEPFHWRLEPFEPGSSNTFAALEGDSNFPALGSKAFIDFRVYDDALPSTNKLFNLTFSSSDPHFGVGRSNDVLVVVLDNDRPNDPGRGTDYPIDKAAFYPDGKLVIAGAFLNVNGSAHPQLARLLPSGEVDRSFLPPRFDGRSPVIRGLVPTANGKLVVMGSFTNVGGLTRSYVVRLNENGTVDESFDASSAFPYAPVAITGLPDSSLLVLGSGGSFNGVRTYTNQFHLVTRTNLGAIVRLDANGNKDTNFTTGVRLHSSGQIAQLSNGGCIVAGDISAYTNAPPNSSDLSLPFSRYLARLLPDGRLDTSFGARLTVSTISAFPDPTGVLITSLSVGTDGAVLLTGALATANGVTVKSLARFNTDGSLDLKFTTNAASSITSSEVFLNAVLTGTGQTLLAARNSQSDLDFAFRANADGTPDSSLTMVFSQRGPGYFAPAFWISSHSNLAALANTRRSRLAWFYPDGTPAADSAAALRNPTLQADGNFQFRVDGRTTGTLVVQRSSDFISWKDISSQPLLTGLHNVTIPTSSESPGSFFRALVVGP